VAEVVFAGCVGVLLKAGDVGEGLLGGGGGGGVVHVASVGGVGANGPVGFGGGAILVDVRVLG